MAFRSDNAPLVGLLYNPAVPSVLEEAGALVEYIEVIPERLWYDLGRNEPVGRFRHVPRAIETLKKCSKGRVVAGHGMGLSLPNAAPLDKELLRMAAAAAQDLDFSWYSEHLSMFFVPHGGISTAKTGPGLPVIYNEETFEVLREKLSYLHEAMGIPLMLENGGILAPIPDMDMSEPEFLNHLYRELGCGTLLNLRTVYLNWRNGGPEPLQYLAELDPAAVHEIHLAGGELAGPYADLSSQRTPPEVWSWAFEFVPRFKNLRAITFEFHESSFDRLGITAIVNELKCMHLLAHLVIRPKEVSYAD